MTLDAWLAERRLVAILRGLTPDRAIAVGTALIEAGFRCLEVPLNSPEPIESIRLLNEHFGDRAIIGAGTVLDTPSVARVARAGGRIVISPNCNADVIRATKAAGLIALPAFFTPSEAFAAIDAGADALKLFPAEIAGPQGLKAMLAVLPPHVPVLPVGGIDETTMAEWLAAGARGFGLGSALFRPDYDIAQIEHRARVLIAAWKCAAARTTA